MKPEYLDIHYCTIHPKSELLFDCDGPDEDGEHQGTVYCSRCETVKEKGSQLIMMVEAYEQRKVGIQPYLFRYMRKPKTKKIQPGVKVKLMQGGYIVPSTSKNDKVIGVTVC